MLRYPVYILMDNCIVYYGSYILLPKKDTNTWYQYNTFLYKQMCNYNKGNKGAGQHEGNNHKPDQRYKEQLYRKIVI